MVSRHRTALILVLALRLLGGSTPVDAAPTDQNKTLARQLVKMGQRAVKQRRFGEALRQFKAAYHHWPRREIRFNIALVYYQMGKRLAAHQALLAYLERASATERRLLPPFFKQLLREVGVISVSVQPGDVSIRIDGRYAGMGRVTRSIFPGKHLVTFHRDGQEVGRKELTVEGGGTSTWEHRVSASLPPPVARRPPPRRRSPMPAPPPSDRPSRRGTVHWAWFAAATGMTAVAGGLMIWLGLETNELEDQFHTAPTPELQSRGRRYRAATNAMVGLTSAAAITAVVLAFYTRWTGSERSQARRITPLISPGGAGVVVRF